MKKSTALAAKILACLLVLTCLPLFASTVSAEKYLLDTDYVVDDVEVTYLFSVQQNSEGHVVQGLTIHNGIIFQLHDGGRCTTYNVDTGEKLGEFHLGSFYEHNHCGNGNFGWIYPEGNTEFPALYVSGDLTTKACYVENVTTTSAELIQTIYFDIDPSYTAGQVILDRARNRIVYMQREKSSIGDLSNVYRMSEFPIPALDAGSEIHFTNADMLCEPYVLPFYPGIYQGACIYEDTIIQTHGKSGTPNAFGAKVGIVFYDTVTHDFTRAVDLTNFVNVEPQGVFVHEDRIIMGFVNGEYYEITPKPQAQLPTEGYDIFCVDREQDLLSRLFDKFPAGQIKSLDGDLLVWDNQTGSFSVPAILDLPYPQPTRVMISGTALSHEWGDYQANNDATCTSDGTQTRVCAHDEEGTHHQTVSVPDTATGHSFGEWEVTVPATEEAVGESVRVCTNCSQREVKELAMLQDPANKATPIISAVIGFACGVACSGLGVGIALSVRKRKQSKINL